MAWRLSYLLTCNRITLGTLGIGARKQGIGNVTLVMSFVELFLWVTRSGFHFACCTNAIGINDHTNIRRIGGKFKYRALDILPIHLRNSRSWYHELDMPEKNGIEEVWICSSCFQVFLFPYFGVSVACLHQLNSSLLTLDKSLLIVIKSRFLPAAEVYQSLFSVGPILSAGA